jgi:ribosomal protein S18 acetylase RimI-like enzyme
MSFEIRDATSDDYEAIGELTVAAYRGDGQTFAGHPYEPTLVDVAGRSKAGTLLVCASESGEIVGSVLLVTPGSEFAELAREGEAEFRFLAVSPSAQGQGVGPLLALACVERARALGAGEVVICVRDFAEAAKRMYKRLGFVRDPSLDWSPYEGVTLQGLRFPIV